MEFLFSHFSTIHTGHIRYLKNASKKGKELVVALIGDNNDSISYQFNQIERAEGLDSIELIDKIVFLNNNELNLAIKKIRPKCLILGKEFEITNSKIIRNAIELIKNYGGEVIFDAGVINYATTDLLKTSSRNY